MFESLNWTLVAQLIGCWFAISILTAAAWSYTAHMIKNSNR